MTKDESYNYNESFDYADQVNDLDGQRPNIDLSVNVRLQSANDWANRYLSVALTGTNVSADGAHNPPQLAHDDRTHRGWYTESVLVTMWLSDTSLFRKNDGPVTTGSSVTVTSGTSEQLGGSVGAFGDMPTVGIQGGISMSKSFSQSIPDFSIINNSNQTTVSQLFHLTSTREGHYGKPLSMKHQEGLHMPYFVGLPEKTKAGLAIDSQVIWATPDAGYAKKLTLNVKLDHTLTKVWMHRYGIGKLSAHLHSQSRQYHWNAHYDIDFAAVNF